jgi:asparagine synthase (glutamine-hydrolysing)
MCGIAGIVSSEKPFLLNELEQLNNDMRHRGPDDEGYSVIHDRVSSIIPLIGKDSSENNSHRDIRNLTNPHAIAGIAHRRFSIIDTSSAGRQPFLSTDKSYSVSFNGEIYNYIELRDELISLGYGPFKTETDTEVLVKSYEAWGTDCFKRFNGFWAIAILDSDKLILSRDRVGKKPLYYTDDSSFVVFSSEIKPIVNYRRRNGYNLTLNDKAAFDYLRLDRRNSSFSSFFSEIKQIEPSTFTEFKLTNIAFQSTSKFWSLDNINRNPNFNLKSGIESFNEVLENSISLRLRADVPIEANLSGGLDSGAIVAVASKILDSRNEKLTAHNIRYSDNKTLDESISAEQIAKYCGADFRLIEMDKSNALINIDQLIMAAEEPVHSMAALVQNEAWQQISSEGFKVILHGSANDEIMLGYDYLKKIELINRINSRQFKNLFRDIIHQPIIFLKLVKWIIGEDRDKSLEGSEYFSPVFLEKNSSRHFDYLSGLDHVNKKTGDRMLSDLKHLRIPYWCNLMDKSMMNVPVEVRMPFLDHNFLENVFSVPEKYLLRNGYTKYLLRRALEGKLPEAIVWQRAKVGFSVPKKSWLLSNTDELLEDFDYPGLDRFFNVALVKSSFHSMNPDLAWRFLNFAKWYRLNKL